MSVSIYVKVFIHTYLLGGALFEGAGRRADREDQSHSEGLRRSTEEAAVHGGVLHQAQASHWYVCI